LNNPDFAVSVRRSAGASIMNAAKILSMASLRGNEWKKRLEAERIRLMVLYQIFVPRVASQRRESNLLHRAAFGFFSSELPKKTIPIN